jgi:hypothetical protein
VVDNMGCVITVEYKASSKRSVNNVTATRYAVRGRFQKRDSGCTSCTGTTAGIGACVCVRERERARVCLLLVHHIQSLANVTMATRAVVYCTAKRPKGIAGCLVPLN